MSMRMSHSLKESLAADFLDRYAHLFDAYIHVRGAWLALPLMLVQQYVMAAFLGLAVASGGCHYEQVRIALVCSEHRTPFSFTTLLVL